MKSIWINMCNKGALKGRTFSGLLVERLMTAKLGHFMVLNGSNRLASLKLKPIKLKAHNENQCEVLNFINKD